MADWWSYYVDTYWTRHSLETLPSSNMMVLACLPPIRQRDRATARRLLDATIDVVRRTRAPFLLLVSASLEIKTELSAASIAAATTVVLLPHYRSCIFYTTTTTATPYDCPAGHVLTPRSWLDDHDGPLLVLAWPAMEREANTPAFDCSIPALWLNLGGGGARRWWLMTMPIDDVNDRVVAFAPPPSTDAHDVVIVIASLGVLWANGHVHSRTHMETAIARIRSTATPTTTTTTIAGAIHVDVSAVAATVLMLLSASSGDAADAATVSPLYALLKQRAVAMSNPDQRQRAISLHAATTAVWAAGCYANYWSLKWTHPAMCRTVFRPAVERALVTMSS
jgi:hypothetical protein